MARGGSKYKNQPTEVNGVRFASKKEAGRYKELLWLASVGKITGLALQVRYPLRVNDRLITTYVSDFDYTTDTGESIVEDAKGYRTQIYLLKKKLMAAVYDIKIVEV